MLEKHRLRKDEDAARPWSLSERRRLARWQTGAGGAQLQRRATMMIMAPYWRIPMFSSLMLDVVTVAGMPAALVLAALVLDYCRTRTPYSFVPYLWRVFRGGQPDEPSPATPQAEALDSFSACSQPTRARRSIFLLRSIISTVPSISLILHCCCCCCCTLLRARCTMTSSVRRFLSHVRHVSYHTARHVHSAHAW
jgi:hypothetical protein